MRSGQWRRWSVAAALAVVACNRGASSPDPSTPGPTPVEEPAATKEAVAAEGGVGAVVQRELEAARKQAALPDVPAGAPLVAVVDGMPIPRTAFDEIYALKLKKYVDRGRTIPPSADRRYRKSIVERLVHHERLRQRVAELGVDVDPAEVEEELASKRATLVDWSKHLERRGETEATLRAMIVAELREELVLERTGALAVSRAEIEAEYDAVKGNHDSPKPRIRASHIVVPVAPAGPGDDPAALEAAAKAEAERIHAEVTAPGADFAAVARARSGGSSAVESGDLGIFTADRMVEEFSKVAFKLKVGEISKPVKTKFGYHVILVTGRWPAGVLPLDALEPDIVERLRMRKLHEGRRSLKDELETAHPVTHHLLTPDEQAARPRSDPPADEVPGGIPGGVPGGVPSGVLGADEDRVPFVERK